MLDKTFIKLWELCIKDAAIQIYDNIPKDIKGYY